MLELWAVFTHLGCGLGCVLLQLVVAGVFGAEVSSSYSKSYTPLP